MHNAMFMKHIDSSSDLLAVQSDYMLLQSQSGDLFQGPFITIFHKDIHFFLRDRVWKREGGWETMSEGPNEEIIQLKEVTGKWRRI